MTYKRVSRRLRGTCWPLRYKSFLICEGGLSLLLLPRQFPDGSDEPFVRGSIPSC